MRIIIDNIQYLTIKQDKIPRNRQNYLKSPLLSDKIDHSGIS